MAGAGVGGVGGAGMLRTRRRDVSVKPNRKLDRKSSRGMIYENEELRLRTIHINAEVEQGQNDIKKLRRENEQLRREIWSLRDEYDKLEDILKRQKNSGESEEYEDRSEEDDDLRSELSCEEDEDEDEERYENSEGTAKGFNREEQLENAENQKISSEKMSSGSLHRLHVEFDDLSVVDEEEEPTKRDKERRDATPSEEAGRRREEDKEEARQPPPILGPRQLHDNIPFYPATYEETSAFGGTGYYTECPFEFPSTIDLMLPTDTTAALLASPRAGLPSDPLISLAGLDSSLDRTADPSLPRIHVPPVGWQNDVTTHLPTCALAPVASTATGTRQVTGKPDSRSDYQKMICLLESSALSADDRGFSSRRGNVVGARQLARQLLDDASAIPDSRTPFSRLLEESTTIGGNVWNAVEDSADAGKQATAKDAQNSPTHGQNADGQIVAASAAASPERPRHFFAPLPSRLKRQQEEESPTASASHFGTGTSSSSGKTVSTVISRDNPFGGQQKGSPDIYVNGAIPCNGEVDSRYGSRTFLSSDNLSIVDGKGAPSGQLTKSISCQDLSSECQSAEQSRLNHTDGKSQMFARSDNTLDNIASDSVVSRPYKSHLNVTLKIPRAEQAPASPETPEIPNLPSIDYRLFRNPFLRNFDKICPNYQTDTIPAASANKQLSLQANDDGLVYHPAPTYGPGVHLDERFRAARLPDQNRLLMLSEQATRGNNKQDIQVTSFERPSPRTLLPSVTRYDLTTLRRLNADRYLRSQNQYQNLPFVPSREPGQFYPTPRAAGVMYYDNMATKVPAQTQTSIDGDSHHEDEETLSAPSSPNGQRRKKLAKRDRFKDPGTLSPAAQRRLKKQSSVTSTDTPDSPDKTARKRPRKLSTTTTSDAQEDKNESRSSSSGQDSPRKDQSRRVSVYVNSKRRSSQTSLKTTRSGSVDASKYADGGALSSERERTNSVSSREIAGGKARKTSTSSGSVPWCACWGNGCI